MITPDNKYTSMQQKSYDDGVLSMHKTGNHKHHDNNPDYWNVLLAPIRENSAAFAGKQAFDFGCGQGRNMVNLLRIAPFEQVDGGDISAGNLDYAKKNILAEWGSMDQTKLFKLNGVDLVNVPSNTYTFVMSTITMQHICVHTIRMNILREKFRILAKGGILSFQMAHDDPPNPKFATYSQDFYDAHSTNGAADVSVSNPDDVVRDLETAGFKNISFSIRTAFADRHKNWIFIRAEKK